MLPLLSDGDTVVGLDESLRWIVMESVLLRIVEYDPLTLSVPLAEVSLSLFKVAVIKGLAYS